MKDLDTYQLIAVSSEARAKKSPMRVFDWHKAARLIRERQPEMVDAGLGGDWSPTAATIYENNEPVIERYGAYLASCWAEPCIELDGKREPCERPADAEYGEDWDAKTTWPESALAILRGAP